MRVRSPPRPLATQGLTTSGPETTAPLYRPDVTNLQQHGAYAPVRRQLCRLLRSINKRRRRAGLSQLPKECLFFHRTTSESWPRPMRPTGRSDRLCLNRKSAPFADNFSAVKAGFTRVAAELQAICFAIRTRGTGFQSCLPAIHSSMKSCMHGVNEILLAILWRVVVWSR